MTSQRERPIRSFLLSSSHLPACLTDVTIAHFSHFTRYLYALTSEVGTMTSAQRARLSSIRLCSRGDRRCFALRQPNSSAVNRGGARMMNSGRECFLPSRQRAARGRTAEEREVTRNSFSPNWTRRGGGEAVMGSVQPFIGHSLRLA